VAVVDLELDYPSQGSESGEMAKMIFKASFSDGSTPPVHANDPSQARHEAIRHFPGRVVVKIERAGLLDMTSRRPDTAHKPHPAR
jgi:hypothetical protein